MYIFFNLFPVFLHPLQKLPISPLIHISSLAELIQLPVYLFSFPCQKNQPMNLLRRIMEILQNFLLLFLVKRRLQTVYAGPDINFFYTLFINYLF